MAPKGQIKSEGLGFVRVLMVLSSLAPLFALMAVRGTSLFCIEWPFVVTCLALIVLPFLVLLHRVRTARKNDDVQIRKIGRTEDHRSHFLTYLFATLLPFYREEFDTVRELIALLIALTLIVFLFWRLNLHYVNLYFAFRGFNVFTVWPPKGGGPYAAQESFMLITRRKQLVEGESVTAYRLSNTVYLEDA